MQHDSAKRNMRWRKLNQIIAHTLMRISGVILVGALAIILIFVTVKGIGAISWEFLSQFPREEMTKGGIFPCILGTFYLTLGAVILALPLGVATAIYLSEYAKEGRLVRLIRLGVNNLAGVPSVVFGLFGLSLFVVTFRFGMSILAGSLTLGLLILPVIIRASEEALLSVPHSYREASLALAATKWQTIYKTVLPSALPGILTGSILSIGRAAGETAPIMFTAAVFMTFKMPDSILRPVMALPYHIYVLATAGTHIEETRPLQYGTAMVLIMLVLGVNLVAIILRNRLRRRHE
jgi:phosphate transport system permease protein